MTATRSDIQPLAADFTAAHPKLDQGEQRVALAALRLLGGGRPFADRELAERTDRPLDDVAGQLDSWMVQRDQQERVVALAGLTLEPTRHSLEVDGRTLYAWCALDTLFLPELLGRPARVRSTCPETGETISLAVGVEGVRDLEPPGAVMTLHDVAGFDLQDVVETFCCYVNFFASEEAARTWAERSEGSYVVSIADGFEYGRLYNHGQFGAALDSDRG